MNRDIPPPWDNKSFMCDICSFLFNNSLALEEHRKTHSYLDSRLQSQECSYYSNDISYLYDIIRGHTGGNESFNCDFCGSLFKNSSDLEEHRRTHCYLDNRQQSQECSYYSNDSCNLNRHILNGHTKSNESFKCDFCSLIFTSSSALQSHRRTHSYWDNRHRCRVCPYSSNNISNLNRHLLIHTGVRPHQCMYCGYAFTTKAKLQRHILIHTGEQPFACNTCGKTFTQSHHLEIHKRVHTQEKPYSCTRCDFKCSNDSNLRRHVALKHTREFKHTCSFCGTGFYSPSELKKHIESIHQRRKPEIVIL